MAVGIATANAGFHAPRATYRVQLTRAHGFRTARELVPYLARLGISHCYFSPYLKTRPDSTHGYDVIDHSVLNPELGDDEEHAALCRALVERGMGQIVDIVPNHIGIMGSDNKWWLDVLENGQASAYADYFDIDWQPVTPELKNKVLVPVLGDQYGNVLLRGELTLRYDERAGELSVFYFQHRFPLDPATYPRILQRAADGAAPKLKGEPALIELESIIRSLQSLPHHSSTDEAERQVRAHEISVEKRRLAELTRSSPLIAAHIARNVASYNGIQQRRETFAPLHRLLESQPYRLAYWRVAVDEINYRRFFDINDLAGLRTQNDAVLDATHRRLLQLVAEGKIHGFRVDHPDGLYDPRGYLRWLRRELTTIGHPHHYLVVEKILAADEYLPEDWPVHGTTGYDYSFAVNALFVCAPGERAFDRVYRNVTRDLQGFEAILERCKRRIMLFHLSSELTVLANLLNRLAELRLETRDFTLNAVRATLLELIVAFPVYRTYVTEGDVSEQDREHIEWAVSHARSIYEGQDEGILALIRSLLLFELPDDVDYEYRRQAAQFTAKFQQLTGPVMAKSLEDTCIYRYVRLLSLNEVGSDPRRFGMPPAAFHRANLRRAAHWPHSLIATSTHDSKRSEDVRARLNVLSELPGEWRAAVQGWRRLNEAKRRSVGAVAPPSAIEEYFLYQTLVGTWPADATTTPPDYLERIEAYMVKAMREAKSNTSWSTPNTDYEAAVINFIRETLTAAGAEEFVSSLVKFVQRIAVPGFLNSLGQTLLKLTSPGVPDIYQGNELWDFSLVDPDNRRPVDYALRDRLLAELENACADREGAAAALPSLLRSLGDGRVKLYLTWRALTLRAREPELFEHGVYVPLEVHGARSEHVCAYARELQGRAVVVAVGRWFTKLCGEIARWPDVPFDWQDTEIVLPAAGRYEHLLAHESISVDNRAIRAERLFARFPAALLLPV
jgi:(1->4)-alpha-D-glucan 1-alpha-D-glucosylmutase